MRPEGRPEDCGDLLYRTGDRGRWRADGVLEFLGREDGQVKVRGVRVEVEEVERVICEHGLVRDAVVRACTQAGETRLAAYYVARSGAELESAVVRQFVRARLPEAMVPTAWRSLEALPVTANGKVDRLALPAPTWGVSGGGEAVLPATPVEEVVAGIWSTVLGRPVEDVTADFFELGGHSLLATQVLARVQAAYGVSLRVQEMFSSPTVRGLSRAIAGAERGDSSSPPLVRRPESGRSPLSFGQQRLWFLVELMPTSTAYTMAAAVRLRGGLVLGALRGSVTAVARRHEVLRTVIESSDGEAWQVVQDAARVPVPVVDLTGVSVAERSALTRTIAAAESERPFDVSRGPLFRVRVIRVAAEEHVALVTQHHLISDGWSMGVLVRELGVLYGAAVEGTGASLPALRVQYGDYAAWQRARLTGAVRSTLLAYWKQALAGAPERLALPTDRPRPRVATYRSATVDVTVPPALAAAVRGLAREEQATPFMVLVAALGMLLGRYSGQRDVVLGTPIANRTRAELEGMLGFFANTLALRVRLTPGATFRTLLRQVRETTLGAYTHQDLPFDLLVQELGIERDAAANPLFQVGISMQNAASVEPSFGNLATAPMGITRAAVPFDLNLSVSHRGEAIGCSWQYSTDLFDESTVRRLAETFVVLLSRVVDDPLHVLDALSLLSAEERSRVEAWNATGASYASASLQEGFERQAARTPAAVAVESETEVWSYAELMERSGAVAEELRALGVCSDVRVAVSMERSCSAVAAVLGVLRAGGAYVPLDPEYPAARLSYMLEDSGARVLLVDSSGAAWAGSKAGVTVLRSDTAVGALRKGASAGSFRPQQLAYVMYTSGTTGRPKGVMVPHAAIVNRLQWMAQAYPLGADDAVLQKTSMSFDASVWELFLPLWTGGRVVLARPGGEGDPGYLVERVRRSRATVLQLVPSMLRPVLDAIPGLGSCETLRRVYCGGETLGQDLVEAFWSRVPQAELCNLYGPTEWRD